jgi:hypothetical protein
MRKSLGRSLLVGLAIATCGGCALCDNSFDDAYNAYGGLVPRHDLGHGRVGSVLSDPAFQYLGPDSADTHSTEADLYHSEFLRDAPVEF